MTLELRPNCEYCDKDLSPDAVDARICSYECAFCGHCVDTVLFHVCPNCGGGFVPRPHQPGDRAAAGFEPCQAAGLDRARVPPYEKDEIDRFARIVRDIPPESR